MSSAAAADDSTASSLEAVLHDSLDEIGELPVSPPVDIAVATDTHVAPSAHVSEPDEDEWAGITLPELSEPGTLERVTELNALVSQVQALRAEALVRLQHRHAGTPPVPSEDVDGHLDVLAAGQAHPRVVDEVAPSLSISRTAAHHLVAEAEQLVRCLPRTFALLSDGLLDYPQARTVALETAALPEDLAAEVDRATSDSLIGKMVGEVGRLVAHAVHAIDAEAVRRRHRRKRAQREVRYTPLPDGIAAMTMTGPADVLRPLFDIIDAHARAVGRSGTTTAEDCSSGACRFDVAAALVRQPLAGSSSTAGQVRAEVVVAMTTLLGLDEDPAQLTGHGDIPADVARQIAEHARLRRVFTDPRTGTLVHVDSHTYPPGSVPCLRSLPPDDDPGDGPPPEPGGGPGPGGGGPSPRPGPGRDPGPGPDPRGGADSRSAASSALPPGRRSGTGRPSTTGRRRATDTDGATASQAPASETWCLVSASGGGPYRVPVGMARFVRTRTRRCTAPGCRVPASRCDLDHQRPTAGVPHRRPPSSAGAATRRSEPSRATASCGTAMSSRSADTPSGSGLDGDAVLQGLTAAHPAG